MRYFLVWTREVRCSESGEISAKTITEILKQFRTNEKSIPKTECVYTDIPPKYRKHDKLSTICHTTLWQFVLFFRRMAYTLSVFQENCISVYSSSIQFSRLRFFGFRFLNFDILIFRYYACLLENAYTAKNILYWC